MHWGKRMLGILLSAVNLWPTHNFASYLHMTFSLIYNTGSEVLKFICMPPTAWWTYLSTPLMLQTKTMQHKNHLLWKQRTLPLDMGISVKGAFIFQGSIPKNFSLGYLNPNQLSYTVTKICFEFTTFYFTLIFFIIFLKNWPIFVLFFSHISYYTWFSS